MDVARVIPMMIMNIVLPLALQLYDRRRLDEAQRARSWNFATWGSVLVWLGPLSMLGWIFVTRRRWWRCLIAPLWTLPLLIVTTVADMSLQAARGEELELEGEVGEILLELVVVGIVIVAIMFVVELIVMAWRALKARSPGLRALIAVLTLCCTLVPAEEAEAFELGRDRPLPAHADSWGDTGVGAIRGLTVGPIENSMHPEAGYGTDLGRDALVEARALGADWVAITPFGRVWDLKGGGVDLTFEEPVETNTRDVLQAIHDAHTLGLRVFLVPHLWVETGGWRALIDPGDDEGWARWAASYRRFLLHWATVAQLGQVEMLSVGVELRSWVTTRRAPSFAALINEVRAHYGGLLTYSANWDDVDRTVILGQLDLIGINAFYPLTDKEGASFEQLAEGGRRIAAQLAELAERWRKPVLLTEMGYTTRADPALRPWEWPDKMSNVVIDQRAQALAYRALLAPMLDASWCAGFFAWRTYADPGDVSQEAEWGFSPRGKLAELVLRDAYAARWASDGLGLWLGWPGAHRARTPGVHAYELSP